MNAVVTKGSWDAIVAKDKNNNLEAVLVYHIRTYLGFKLILMPPLTAYGGLFLNYPKGTKEHSKISFENKIINRLFDELPDHDLFYQQFHPSIKNWLPLHWKKYKQSTRYTYQLNLKRDNEKLWGQLKSSVRTNVRNAEPHCQIDTISFEDYWDNLSSSYEKRNKKNPFRKDLLSRIYNAFNSENRCRLNCVRDNLTQEILAGIFIIEDEKSSYYLSGFFHPDKKTKYAFSFLIWKSIINSNTEIFDFEGSIIPDIEKFFRSFGGQMIPHFKIWKVNSPLLKLIFKFKRPGFLG